MCLWGANMKAERKVWKAAFAGHPGHPGRKSDPPEHDPLGPTEHKSITHPPIRAPSGRREAAETVTRVPGKVPKTPTSGTNL